jgi:phage tail-like protein
MGQPVNFYAKHNFRVVADGLTFAYFTTCGEIAAEVAVIEHYESGRRQPHKMPGLETWPDVELERGSSDDQDLWNMFLDTYSAATGLGKDHPVLDRDIDIEQLNQQREVVKRWTLHHAWVSKYTEGNWDAKANEVVMEKITLTYEWAEPTWG